MTSPSSRRPSLTTAGSRRGSLCPRISSATASRLMLHALFGYITHDDVEMHAFMLPIQSDGSVKQYVVSDYCDAVEAVLSQLELELEVSSAAQCNMGAGLMSQHHMIDCCISINHQLT